MSDWIHSLPVGGMALLVFTTTYLVAVLLHLAAGALGRSERGRAFRSISPALLSPLGVTFGLFVVFTAAQVWSDLDRASAAVSHEASALRTVVLLAGTFPDSSRERLRVLVRQHIDQARSVEWPAMATGRETLTAVSTSLAQALATALALDTTTPARMAAQREVIAALDDALDARRQRILVSHAEVNGVKWSGLLLQALCTLVAIALVHGENRSASVAGLGVFATAVAVCILLILAHDRPFTGRVSVKPTPLLEVRPDSVGASTAR